MRHGAVPERDAQVAAQFQRLIAPGGRELVTSMLTTSIPEGGTWATVVGLITLFIGTTAVFGEIRTTMPLTSEVCPTAAFASHRAAIPSVAQC